MAFLALIKAPTGSLRLGEEESISDVRIRLLDSGSCFAGYS